MLYLCCTLIDLLHSPLHYQFLVIAKVVKAVFSAQKTSVKVFLNQVLKALHVIIIIALIKFYHVSYYQTHPTHR